MAHQAHALPWQTLADNFKFVHASPRYLGRTNLYPRSKLSQGKQLQHFAKVFARVIDEYSTIERKKYDAEHRAPELDEIIISNATAKTIEKVVREYMKEDLERHPALRIEPLPRSNRTMDPWITVMTWNSCHPGDCLLKTDELLRTLLLYGEMDTLFRIAAHPAVRLAKMWAEEGRFAFDLGGYGFSEVKETALLAYICLNVFYLKPELYDTTSREQMLKDMAKRNVSTVSPELYDYRTTAAYQQMLVYCTGTGYLYPHYGAHKLPHREFFGVPFGMYTSQVEWHAKTNLFQRYGTVPMEDLVDKKFPYNYIPSKREIPVVIGFLHKKRLPTELALQIIEFADYSPKGRLPIRDDPLHIGNSEELKKYLSYCWKLLVRTDMLLKANGTWLDWECEVTEAIYKLFGVPYPQMTRVFEKREVNGSVREREVNDRRRRREFV